MIPLIGWDQLGCEAGLLWVSVKWLLWVDAQLELDVQDGLTHQPGNLSCFSLVLFHVALQQLAQVLSSLFEDNAYSHTQYIWNVQPFTNLNFCLISSCPIGQNNSLGYAHIQKNKNQIPLLGKEWPSHNAKKCIKIVEIIVTISANKPQVSLLSQNKLSAHMQNTFPKVISHYDARLEVQDLHQIQIQIEMKIFRCCSSGMALYSQCKSVSCSVVSDSLWPHGIH